MSAKKRQFLKVPYGAYHNDPIPDENAALTHVEKGSKAGELLRRYWQPICLATEVGELPVRTRMFGEDLVVFRTRQDEVGILDLHCPHRGASLEFGISYAVTDGCDTLSLWVAFEMPPSSAAVT